MENIDFWVEFIVIIGNVTAFILIISCIVASSILIPTLIVKNWKIKSESDEIINFISKKIARSFKVISNDIYLKIQNLKSFSEEDRALLIRDLATLDDMYIEEWLREAEELEK